MLDFRPRGGSQPAPSSALLPELVEIDLRGYLAAVDEGLPTQEPSGPLFTALLLRDTASWLGQRLRSSPPWRLPRRGTRVPRVYWG